MVLPLLVARLPDSRLRLPRFSQGSPKVFPRFSQGSPKVARIQTRSISSQFSVVMQRPHRKIIFRTTRMAKDGNFYTLLEFQQYYGPRRGDHQYWSSSACRMEFFCQPASAGASSSSRDYLCSQPGVQEPVLQPSSPSPISLCSQPGVQEPVLQPSATRTASHRRRAQQRGHGRMPTLHEESGLHDVTVHEDIARNPK